MLDMNDESRNLHNFDLLDRIPLSRLLHLERRLETLLLKLLYFEISIKDWSMTSSLITIEPWMLFTLLLFSLPIGGLTATCPSPLVSKTGTGYPSSSISHLLRLIILPPPNVVYFISLFPILSGLEH